MRPHSRSLPGRSPVSVLLLLLAVGVGVSCREPTGYGRYGVRSIAISVTSLELRPGYLMHAIATPLDGNGDPVAGQTVTWRSLSPATLKVSDSGLLLAVAPGTGLARASVAGVSSVLELALRNPPIASLTLDADSVRLELPGGALELTATPRDSDGVVILRPELTWESSASRIADVASTGRVTATAAGRALVIVRGDDRADTLRVTVAAPASPTAPSITAVAPAQVVPGQNIFVTGTAFAPSIGGNSAMLDGTPVIVTAATTTQLTLALPAATQFPCSPSGLATLQVTTAGGIGTRELSFQMAPQRALSVGQSIVLPAGLESRCLELSPADGRYIVTIQNTARALGNSATGVTLGGRLTSIGGVPLMAGALRAAAPLPAIALRTAPSVTLRQRSGAQIRRRLAAHARLLASNRGTLDDALAPAATSGLARAALQTPVVGTVLNVRIPNLDAENVCVPLTSIGARTAFVSPHLVILEDTAPTFNGAPTLRGTMDDMFAVLGAEFEEITWPIVTKFGNPLVMDSRLDDNGRIAIVVTPRMNQMLGGTALAATVGCDLFSRAQQQGSNVGEYVYTQVPTTNELGMGDGTRARWLSEIRGTLAHEVKHVVSYAERLVRGFASEEEWLEEATARHAEELYARAVYGSQQFGNHGYDVTLRCEVLGPAAIPPCADSPRAMLPHFDALWDFLDAPATRSPLGALDGGDFTFYGSGWALTRWALDHTATTEQAFYTALTLSGLSGVQNLEARTGRPWTEMMAEWSLAMATDDRIGLITASPRERFPSWNLPQVFEGLCIDRGPCANPAQTPSYYPRAHPLQPAARQVGDFEFEVSSLVGAGFVVVELRGGGPTARQLLHLRGYRGAALESTAKMAVMRVQ